MKKLYLTLQLASMSLFAFGQYTIPEDIPTPNAASIARYGDIPVSYYTGRANISIPLFSTEVKGMPFNMTLDYDTSGLLLNSLPGWTGQNWSLNAGGVITRCLQGAPDEFSLDELFGTSQSYFSNSSLIKQINDENAFNLSDKISFSGIDLAPDIYVFNFMGKTGKFFFGNDGQWKIQSEENLDIVFDTTDENNYQRPFYEDLLVPIPQESIVYQRKQPKVIKGFVIRDDNGYQYKFGYKDDAIEYTIPIYSIYNNHQHVVSESQGKWQKFPEPWKAMSWYLTEVRDRYGNMLYTLDYERGYFIVQFNLTRGSNLLSQKIYLPSLCGGSYSNETSLEINGICDDGTLNSPVYLKRITCANGINYTFERTASARCVHSLYPSLFSEYKFNDKAWNVFLSGINDNNALDGPRLFFYLQADQTDKVDLTQYQYLKDGDICCNATFLDTDNRKKYKFYDPLRSTRLCELAKITMSTENSQDSTSWRFNYNNSTRLFLSSLQLEGNNHTIDQKYKFEYMNAAYLPHDYLSTAVDHWGYYNGEPHIYKLPQEVGYRKPDAQRMQYGMLNKVTFPTGGYLVLGYEANTYTSYLNHNHTEMISCNDTIAGGLRIARLAEYEKDGSLLVNRTFEYRGGELYLTPQYVWNWYASGPDGNTVEEMVECSTSIFPLSNTFGPHLGYSQVIENVSGGNKAIFNYSNFSGKMDEQPVYRTAAKGSITPYDRYSSHDYRHGRLLSCCIYDKAWHRLDSVNTEYEVEGNIKNEYVLSSNYVLKNTSNPLYKYRDGCIYKIFYPRYKEIRKTESVYNSDGSILTTTNENSWTNMPITIPSPYEHKADVCLLSSATCKRQGASSRTLYTYPVIAGNVNFLSSFYLTPDEFAYYRNGNHIKTERTTFKSFGTNSLWCPEKVIEISPTGESREILSFKEYTDNGTLTSYRKSGLETTLTWDAKENFLIQKDEGGKLTTRYCYSPSGKLTSVSKSNGCEEYYDYDVFGRLVKKERKNGNSRETTNLYRYKYCNE